MSRYPFQDARATGLLSRVRDDVSQLREDFSHLLRHTTHRTLPEGAKELADTARQRLADGSSYAVSRFRSLKGHSPSHREQAWIGGALLLGVLAVGAYALYRRNCACSAPKQLKEGVEEAVEEVEEIAKA